MLQKYIPTKPYEKREAVKALGKQMTNLISEALVHPLSHGWRPTEGEEVLATALSLIEDQKTIREASLVPSILASHNGETLKITSDLEAFSTDEFYLPKLPNGTLWVETSDISDVVMGLFFGSSSVFKDEMELFRGKYLARIESDEAQLSMLDLNQDLGWGFEMTQQVVNQYREILDSLLDSHQRSQFLLIVKKVDGEVTTTLIPFINYTIATTQSLSSVFIGAGEKPWIPEELGEDCYGVLSVVCDVLRRIDQGEFVEDREVVVQEVMVAKKKGKKQKRKRRVKMVEETILRFRHKDSLPREVTRSVTEGESEEVGGERKPYEGTSHHREIWVTEEYASRHDLDILDIEERTKTYKSGEATKLWCKVRIWADFGRENTKPVVKKYRV